MEKYNFKYNNPYDIEVEFAEMVNQLIKDEDEANILLAIFKQYGKIKYKEGLKGLGFVMPFT